MKEVSGYDVRKDPRLINCKTECGNERCYARRYGLFAEKTCPNFVEPKPLTNADRIRSMTDEELAEFLWKYAGIGVCPPITCPATEKCWAEKCWLYWLGQEVCDA